MEFSNIAVELGCSGGFATATTGKIASGRLNSAPKPHLAAFATATVHPSRDLYYATSPVTS